MPDSPVGFVPLLRGGGGGGGGGGPPPPPPGPVLGGGGGGGGPPRGGGRGGPPPPPPPAPGPGNRSLGTGRRSLTLGLYLHLFAVEQDVDGAIFIGAVIGNAHPLQLIQHLLMGMAIVIAFPYGDHRQGGVHSL